MFQSELKFVSDKAKITGPPHKKTNNMHRRTQRRRLLVLPCGGSILCLIFESVVKIIIRKGCTIIVFRNPCEAFKNIGWVLA